MDLKDDAMALTNIELKIKNDKDGRFKDESIEFLATQLLKVKSDMNNGVSPDRFKELTQLKDAINCASEVINKLWESKHRYIGKGHTLRYAK